MILPKGHVGECGDAGVRRALDKRIFIKSLKEKEIWTYA